MSKYIFGITLLLLIASSTLGQETKTIQTRFGALTVNDAGVLLFKGIPVQPKIEANDSLDLGEPYQIGDADVVLVTDNGGTSCPAIYHFVSVTRSGAKATPSFGSCRDVIKI